MRSSIASRGSIGVSGHKPRFAREDENAGTRTSRGWRILGAVGSSLLTVCASAVSLPYCGDPKVSGECIYRVVPVAVSTPGARGSFFRTSVTIIPFGPPGRLVFHPTGQVASDADPSIVFNGDVQTFPDIVVALGRQGIGSLDWVLPSPIAPGVVGVPELFVEISNDTPDGRPASEEDVVDPSARSFGSQVLSIGYEGSLIVPDTVRRRFSVGVRTLQASHSCSTLIFLWDSGNLFVPAARAQLSLPADSFEQIDATTLFCTPLRPNQYLTVLPDIVAGCPTIAYGVSVDNQTNSPSLRIVRASHSRGF